MDTQVAESVAVGSLQKLDFAFSAKPLLIGGKAMEYYGLRKAGADVDFVVTDADYARLAQSYPDNLKDIWGDLGVCVHDLEIWRTICLFGYDFLAAGAVEQATFRIISLEKLLFLKALAMREAKYHRDLELIVNEVLRRQYSPPVPA